MPKKSKGRMIRVHTKQVGPRIAAQAAWMDITKLKVERTWIRYTVPAEVDGGHGTNEFGSVGMHLPLALQRLESGDYLKVVYFSLNADYHTFTVMTFTAE